MEWMQHLFERVVCECGYAQACPEELKVLCANIRTRHSMSENFSCLERDDIENWSSLVEESKAERFEPPVMPVESATGRLRSRSAERRGQLVLTPRSVE